MSNRIKNFDELLSLIKDGLIAQKVEEERVFEGSAKSKAASISLLTRERHLGREESEHRSESDALRIVWILMFLVVNGYRLRYFDRILLDLGQKCLSIDRLIHDESVQSSDLLPVLSKIENTK